MKCLRWINKNANTTRYIFVFAFPFILFSLLGGMAISWAKGNEHLEVTVKYIVDGDSLIVAGSGEKHEIRLYGIDTPEWGQPYAKEAKAFLIQTVLGKKVKVRKLYYDKYGRNIALVYLGDDCLNEILVARGMAWVHIAYCKRPVCNAWRALQAKARKQRTGLWKEREPTPPWEWKRKKHR